MQQLALQSMQRAGCRYNWDLHIHGLSAAGVAHKQLKNAASARLGMSSSVSPPECTARPQAPRPPCPAWPVLLVHQQCPCPSSPGFAQLLSFAEPASKYQLTTPEQVEDLDRPPLKTMLYVTIDGVIGVMASLPPSQYHFFAKLQASDLQS